MQMPHPQSPLTLQAVILLWAAASVGEEVPLCSFQPEAIVGSLQWGHLASPYMTLEQELGLPGLWGIWA